MPSAVAIDEYEGEVPVIDFSLLKDAYLHDHDDTESTYIKVRNVCEEWGCFSVANHGVKEEIIHEMDSAARDVFNLPQEIKQKNILPRNEMGYIPSSPSLPFYESLGILGAPDPSAIQRFSDYLWPQGNPKISNAIHAYASAVQELTVNIIQFILRSFGVSKFDTSEFWGSLRMISIDLPANEIGGSSTHVDHNFIVVLYQDGTGGLQVKSKAGKWVDVKPVANSFIVIMGDCFKALSNGRTHNVAHRVIIERSGERKCRVSMPYFYDFPLEAVVDALPQFVDDHHPRRYNPLVYGEYRKFYIESQRKKIRNKDGFRSETAGEAYLDIFAGIKVSPRISE